MSFSTSCDAHFASNLGSVATPTLCNSFMITLKRIAAAALMTGVGTVAALGFATGTSHADGPGESPIDVWSNYEWCPGDPIPQSDVPIPWDLNGCHVWHYQTPTAENPSVWTPVEGLRASQCPPFAWMCP
jgi:hypothetical protein